MLDSLKHLVIADRMNISEEPIKELPTHFTVAVIMQRRPSTISVWCDHQWEAIGIAATQNGENNSGQAQLVHEEGNTRQYLYRGFTVSLHIDECESYYYNLISPTPRCYVIARKEENDTPVPFLVSMSFDEAHAYMEGDEEVYDVDMPPELYRWNEAFMLAHYAPEKRIKRKRQDWKNHEKVTS